MGCPCPPGKPKCDCPDEQAAPAPQPGGYAGGLSGGTGNTFDRFRAERELPGGVTDWGSRPEWGGFLRPVQRIEAARWARVDVTPEAVGFHVHRTYVDPTSGSAVSLMGAPVAGGHLFPDTGDDGLPHCGYEFAAGRRP